jgi:peptidoglycan/xylan/chitin deacetylase (PgdA/CDA1 family)
MNYLPRLDAATTARWPDLVDELERWGEAGRVAAFWWRDDDATAPTRQLDLLLRLAGDVPLALAVIPARAEPDLGAALAPKSQVAVLQHGWRHANHGDSGKKSEFPASRDAEQVAAELIAGAERLKALFGDRFVPILAPPWNRFDAGFLPLLAPAGIAALSAMAPAGPVARDDGIPRLDADLDLVAWKTGRGFIGEESALSLLVGRLRRQRHSGDAAVAIGILTHHLVMDDRTHAFLDQLLATVAAHGAARWVAAAELIAQQ